MDYHNDLIPKDIKEKYGRKQNIEDTWNCLHKFSRSQVESTDECPFPCEELEYQTMTTFHTLNSQQDSSNEIISRVEIQLQNLDSYRI